MAVVRCVMGHFYDDTKSASCPHCENIVGGFDDERTVSGAMLERMQRPAGQQVINFGETSPGDEKTVGIYKKKHGWDPVTGWLVCVDGSEKGRDYRLHSGRNFLGRAANMDISVPGDMEVSRENHCSIVFEPKGQAFLLAPGSAVVFFNGQQITESVTLKATDVIKVGVSEFVFIPFCVEGRGW